MLEPPRDPQRPPIPESGAQWGLDNKSKLGMLTEPCVMRSYLPPYENGHSAREATTPAPVARVARKDQWFPDRWLAADGPRDMGRELVLERTSGLLVQSLWSRTSPRAWMAERLVLEANPSRFES